MARRQTLIHPGHFIKAHVINVSPGDTLALRSGPGSHFEPITRIPANGTDITAFDHDNVWDGDSYWYPVVWHGLRGYVGRHYLAADD
jgi:Bacterial SH3 domain